MTLAQGATGVLPRLERLFALGSPPHANRPGFSRSEEEACELVAGWMRDAGLRVHRDGVGNVVGELAGSDPTLPAVWSGSHVDTVPSGGRFDGALGVVVALEAVARIARGAPLERSVAVVVFRDEEGWRFGNGWFGSRYATGTLPPDAFEHTDRAGVTVRDALAAIGYPDAAHVPARRRLPGAFIEVHVEQGSRLAAAGEPIAVVEEIVGMAGFALTFSGRAAHAGATAMADRADALRAAAELVTRVSDMVEQLGGGDPSGTPVATVGDLSVVDGAANVVAADVRCTLDLRAPGSGGLETLSRRVQDTARAVAAARGCTVSIEPTWRSASAAFSGEITGVLAESVAVTLGRAPMPARSWAGHDAGILSEAGVPTGMLFVRSLADGASHSPDEWSSLDDVGLAVDALEGALRRLAA